MGYSLQCHFACLSRHVLHLRILSVGNTGHTADNELVYRYVWGYNHLCIDLLRYIWQAHLYTTCCAHEERLLSFRSYPEMDIVAWVLKQLR